MGIEARNPGNVFLSQPRRSHLGNVRKNFITARGQLPPQCTGNVLRRNGI